MAKLCYMTGKHRCVKYAVSSRGASVNLIDILIKYANAAFVGDEKEATEIADASTSLYPSNRDITFNMISPIPVRRNGTGSGVSLKPVALTRLTRMPRGMIFASARCKSSSPTQRRAA